MPIFSHSEKHFHYMLIKSISIETMLCMYCVTYRVGIIIFLRHFITPIATVCSFRDEIFTIKNFEEDFPVTRDIDILLVNVILQEHCAWVFPCLLPESKPTQAPTQDNLYSVWVQLLCHMTPVSQATEKVSC